MELGYEDIYTDTREAIQASSRGYAPISQLLSFHHYMSRLVKQQILCVIEDSKHLEPALALIKRGHACRRPPGAQRKSMYVWHDDGMSAPRKRDVENDITSFKDLPRCCSLCCSAGPEI